MNRLVIITLVLTTLLLAGCASSKPAEAAGPAGPKKVSVATAQAVTRTVPAAFQETGTFVADETSDIAPLVPGRVIATPVNVGDFVKQGQVVCELDHRDAQLRLDQARAALDQATADAKRYENRVASGDVSRSAFERARTQQETAEAQANAARQQYEAALNGARQSWGAVENAQASLAGVTSQLAQAEKGLADTTIHAPFDGFITARPVAAGEYVGLANKIATIVRIGSMKLELQTPEQRAARGKLGMTVLARVAAYPDRDFTGTVTAVNPSVDPNSRVFILQAKFDNPKGELRPGMFATARVLLPGGESAVFVPRNAVVRDKTTDSYQVFTIDNNTAPLHVVVPGEVLGDQIRIVNGLSGNETVAAGGQSALFDGAQVQGR